MKATFFANAAAFRKWLQLNHGQEKELLVGYYKVHSGKPSMTWSESVDQALCFGWIDGVRRSIDEQRYCIRFTPRKPTSTWSDININKVKELAKAGLMAPAGIKAFGFRKGNKSRLYSYENEPKELSPAYKKQFKMDKPAWDFFSKQAPSYQKVMIHWIMNAKQEQTRLSRLGKTIHACSQQKRLA